MEHQEFAVLLKIIQCTRGPKPKCETVNGAAEICVNGAKGNRYERRLADKINEIAGILKGKPDNPMKSFELYCLINKVADSDSKHAVWLVLRDGCTPSKAASLAGAYSAQVYSMYNSVKRFHQLRMEWELCNGG